MYCAYTIPGMGGNSLMYYYNGKAVSELGLRGALGTSFMVTGMSLLGEEHCLLSCAGLPHLSRYHEIFIICES